MFAPTATFSGFSVDDLEKAKQFYTEILGVKVKDRTGGTELQLPGGAKAWMYAKPDHQPAGYTMLDFVVDDIDNAVDELGKRGVHFEKYAQMPPGMQDEKGIMRGGPGKGPHIAWFTDPAGNILAVLQAAE
jgi:catechol 2,3-dioxygenase-like lactoylglutathione lyase family enzyme